jgi:hypothetical protein
MSGIIVARWRADRLRRVLLCANELAHDPSVAGQTRSPLAFSLDVSTTPEVMSTWLPILPIKRT